MVKEAISRPEKIVSSIFKSGAQIFVKIKQPTVVAVAGSVGKTSTKLMLRDILKTEKKVSCMDDSYNNGLGLYLSVFEIKVPKNNRSILSWAKLILVMLSRFITHKPEILIVEYGIDAPGDMDEMIGFIRPDVSILTAVTPEHMEFLRDLDTVGKEETKILKAARNLAIVNHQDVSEKYLKNLDIVKYGSATSKGQYKIKEWTRKGAVVDFTLDDWVLENVEVQFVSEALIRQMSGAALAAKRLTVSETAIKSALGYLEPAASRMKLFPGIKDSVIIDDSTNFSPDAGVEALKSLKRLPAKKHIAILGNMHELGEYLEKGYSDVAKEFTGIDTLLLVGDLSPKIFGELAKEQGFEEGLNLFKFDSSVKAGVFARDTLDLDKAAILTKGPFGGWFLEEATKRLLQNPSDATKLTRQSEFWQKKKQAHFGEDFNL